MFAVRFKKHVNESSSCLERCRELLLDSCNFEISRLKANLHERGMHQHSSDAIIKRWGNTRYEAGLALSPVRSNRALRK